MTKENTQKTNLVALKLEIVAYHSGEHNEYLRKSIAGDACYSSNNSIEYKVQQMSKVRGEIATLMPSEGSEVVDVSLAKKVDIYQRMEDELLELTERFEADKTVYETVSGEKWKPYKKTTQKDQSAIIEKMNAILGNPPKIQEAN